MAIKNIHIFELKKERIAKPFSQTFSTGKAIPRMVAPQQSQSPFCFTIQKYV